MKKTTIWIDKALTPMYHPKWPTVNDFFDISFDDLGEPGYKKALAKAKEESVYFENLSHVQALINEYIKPDTFMEIDADVEVFKQYRNASGAWVDTDFIDPYVMAQYQTRTIARLKPAEAGAARPLSRPNKPCRHCGAHENQDCQHGGGSCPWADEAASEEFLKPSEEVNEVPESLDDKLGLAHMDMQLQHQGVIIDDLQKQLAAAQAKLKKLEAVTAQILTEGLKSAIVKGFEKRWMEGEGMDPASDLEHTLRELNIR